MGNGNRKGQIRNTPIAWDASVITRAKDQCGLVTEGDERMQQALEEVTLYAGEREVIMLLLGETGTGKELFAKAVHEFSGQRSKGPLVSVNCAGISDSLFESEVFGHERGAFTGAIAKRSGKLGKVAGGGTLLLDEMGTMTPHGQAALLRVFEERDFTSVGSDDAQKLEATIVCATNADLNALIRGGKFRKDLRQRMSPIVIPPFRKRKEAHRRAVFQHLMDTQRLERELESATLHADALDMLLTYDFPGNVREARDSIRKAVLLALRTDAKNPNVGAVEMRRGMADQSLEYREESAEDVVFEAPGIRAVAPAGSDLVTITIVPSELTTDEDCLRLAEMAMACGVMQNQDSQLAGARKLGCNRNTLRLLLREAGYRE